MNIFSIALKEIKQDFRDIKSLAECVLFPILLIIVLGAALGSWFGGSNYDLNTKALYIVQDKGELSDNFEKYMVKNKSGITVKYKKTSNEENAKKEVSRGDYDCLIVLEKNQIELFKNDKFGFNSGLVENILNIYVQKYNTTFEIAKENPRALLKISNESENKSYVENVSLQKKKAPRAIDYYAVTMLTLVMMYAASGSMSAITYEKNEKTQERILCSPIGKTQYITGKVLGKVVSMFLQSLIVIIFSKYVFNVYWGDNIFLVLLVVLTFVIFTVSLGIGFSFIIKDYRIADTAINIIVPVMSFFGGCYFPIKNMFGNNMNIVIQTICKIIPVDWTNKAVFGIVYNNNLGIVPYAMLINIAASAVLIAVSAFIFKKEEA